jgi:hypothetical protein
MMAQSILVNMNMEGKKALENISGMMILVILVNGSKIK